MLKGRTLRAGRSDPSIDGRLRKSRVGPSTNEGHPLRDRAFDPDGVPYRVDAQVDARWMLRWMLGGCSVDARVDAQMTHVTFFSVIYCLLRINAHRLGPTFRNFSPLPNVHLRIHTPPTPGSKSSPNCCTVHFLLFKRVSCPTSVSCFLLWLFEQNGSIEVCQS